MKFEYVKLVPWEHPLKVSQNTEICDNFASGEENQRPNVVTNITNV